MQGSLSRKMTDEERLPRGMQSTPRPQPLVFWNQRLGRLPTNRHFRSYPRLTSCRLTPIRSTAEGSKHPAENAKDGRSDVYESAPCPRSHSGGTKIAASDSALSRIGKKAGALGERARDGCGAEQGGGGDTSALLCSPADVRSLG